MHHAPRQALYCPTGLEFGGPDPQQLQNNRETRILMTDGSYEVIRDDWRSPTSEVPQRPWVGQAVFFDKGIKRAWLPEESRR